MEKFAQTIQAVFACCFSALQPLDTALGLPGPTLSYYWITYFIYLFIYLLKHTHHVQWDKG